MPILNLMQFWAMQQLSMLLYIALTYLLFLTVWLQKLTKVNILVGIINTWFVMALNQNSVAETTWGPDSIHAIQAN